MLSIQESSLSPRPRVFRRSCCFAFSTSTSWSDRGLEKNNGGGVAPEGDVNVSICGAVGGVGRSRRFDLGGGMGGRSRRDEDDACRVGDSAE